MQADKKERRYLPYLMVAPSVVLMILVVMIPIADTVWQSFHTSEGMATIENYSYFFRDELSRKSFLFTLEEACLTTGLSVLASVFLSLYLRFGNSPVSRVIGTIYLLPRFIPGIAAVYAVMNIIKNGGFLSRFMMLLGITYKPNLLYDLKGIVLSNLWFSIPFCTMMVTAALAAVSDSYLESARDCGAGWWMILKTIILPLTYKDIIVAGTFIFMGQIGSFTIPYLTGPNNPKMLGILLYQQAATYFDYNKAAALSVLMFLICMIGAFVYVYTNLHDDSWKQSN